MTDYYAVMGNPIAHSKSPIIHAEFAKQTHQDISYSKIEVPLDQFEHAVRSFQGKGLNITLPFKQRAYELMDQCSNEAVLAKAVNTIRIGEDGKLYGHNTDGIGLVRDLTQNLHLDLKGSRILILGAGGAVREILLPLLEQHPESIVVANRTISTAEQLVQAANNYGNITAVALDAIKGRFDLVINGTSFGLTTTEVPFDPKILSKETYCYDLMYGQELTPFLKWAVNHNVKQVSDGIGMLV